MQIENIAIQSEQKTTKMFFFSFTESPAIHKKKLGRNVGFEFRLDGWHRQRQTEMKKYKKMAKCSGRKSRKMVGKTRKKGKKYRNRF